MHGQEKIIGMRMGGSVPDCVWIDADEPGALHPEADWHVLNNRQAYVTTDANQRPHRLDLRFLKGLDCYIDGTDAARVNATRDACIAAGARRVVAWTMRRLGNDEFPAFRLVDVSDTEGHMTMEACGG